MRITMYLVKLLNILEKIEVLELVKILLNYIVVLKRQRVLWNKDFVYDEDGCEMYSSIGVVDKGTSADILDLKDELMNLSDEERNIILARYFEEMTQSEASRELGISQVQVSRKEGKILEKLRCRL